MSLLAGWICIIVGLISLANGGDGNYTWNMQVGGWEEGLTGLAYFGGVMLIVGILILRFRKK